MDSIRTHTAFSSTTLDDSLKREVLILLERSGLTIVSKPDTKFIACTNLVSGPSSPRKNRTKVEMEYLSGFR